MVSKSQANKRRVARDAVERDPERSLSAIWAEMYGPHEDVAQMLSGLGPAETSVLAMTVARLHAEWLRYLAAGDAMQPPRGRGHQGRGGLRGWLDARMFHLRALIAHGGPIPLTDADITAMIARSVLLRPGVRGQADMSACEVRHTGAPELDGGGHSR